MFRCVRPHVLWNRLILLNSAHISIQDSNDNNFGSHFTRLHRVFANGYCLTGDWIEKMSKFTA
jgi:hypothetical protein